MDKFIVIKNGMVLSLDRNATAGKYNIVIKNNKIFFVDHYNKLNEKEFKAKNPDAIIIDAEDKLIMPGFFNSKLISSYSLNSAFFKKCNYENLNSWLSLNNIDNFLSGLGNLEALKELLKINYYRTLKNGEVFISESAACIKKDFFDIHFVDSEWIKQYFNLVVYDFTIIPELTGMHNFISLGFNTGEEINNYSLTSIKKSLSETKFKLFIDASFSHKTFESIRKVFGKQFIKVLNDIELISSNTIISNPTFISPPEIEILKKRKATVLLCPSDYLNLSDNTGIMEQLIHSGINIIIGTGFTGNDILSELKILSELFPDIYYSNLIDMAIRNPSLIYGISNVTGSIERNKSADLIFFNLNDIRNLFTLPDFDYENFCEFVIKKLTVKDISDLILKGEILIMNSEDKIAVPELKAAKKISEKIYSEGKYSEFKEKYLMRGRVDKLTITDEENEIKSESKEIFVDMTEVESEYTGEGEFTILGKKEEEFEKPWEKDKSQEKKSVLNLMEISSLESELNLFDAEKEEQKISKVETKKTETNQETIAGSDITFPDEAPKPELKKEPEFKEKKMKFGFGDEE